MSNAPTVTPEDIKNSIVGCTYTVLPDGVTTVCQLTLNFGYTVLGTSACVCPENFNKELGETYSRKQAEEKVWPVLGALLAKKMSHVQKAGELSPGDRIFDLGSPKTYLGTKVVRAVPMTRSDYNILREWKLPTNENGEDEGYLVMYSDPGNQNVEGFGGYVSWSPKEVFERSYEAVETPKPKTHIDRMVIESLDLHEKINRLQVFIHSDKFDSLSDEDQGDMHNQISAMKLYVDAVDRRLSRSK